MLPRPVLLLQLLDQNTVKKSRPERSVVAIIPTSQLSNFQREGEKGIAKHPFE
jgi:hypothetical protein